MCGRWLTVVMDVMDETLVVERKGTLLERLRALKY
jgi:hypothetical protein